MQSGYLQKKIKEAMIPVRTNRKHVWNGSFKMGEKYQRVNCVEIISIPLCVISAKAGISRLPKARAFKVLVTCLQRGSLRFKVVNCDAVFTLFKYYLLPFFPFKIFYHVFRQSNRIRPASRYSDLSDINTIIRHNSVPVYKLVRIWYVPVIYQNKVNISIRI